MHVPAYTEYAHIQNLSSKDILARSGTVEQSLSEYFEIQFIPLLILFVKPHAKNLHDHEVKSLPRTCASLNIIKHLASFTSSFPLDTYNVSPFGNLIMQFESMK